MGFNIRRAIPWDLWNLCEAWLPLCEEEFFETFVAGVDGGDVACAVEEAHEGGRHFYRLANGSLYR